MRKFLFTLIALVSVSVSAQVYQSFTMHFVRIEGDVESFEKVESIYMQKVAQAAVKKGDIAFWAFLKRYTVDNIDDEERWNYLFVQSNKDVPSLLSDKNNWWVNAPDVLSKEELEMVQALQKNYTMVKDSRHIFVDEVSIARGLGEVIQFNFARPKNVNGFIAENQSLWKNHFTKNMDKMGLVNWGVGRKIAPRNKNTATVVTWDMFNTLEDLMNYRVGIPSIVNPALKKSKMSSYNPDGFDYEAIFIPIVFAVNQ